jgi:hypothetical protein
VCLQETSYGASCNHGCNLKELYKPYVQESTVAMT